MGESAARERRQARRFPLALALEFDRGVGQTCDVSATGVLFTTSKPPRIGERLRCSLQMAGGETLQFEGQVMRVEKRGAAYGVAAHFDAVQAGLESL